MSRFDGNHDETLTYGQALVELAQRVSWPSEEHGKDVVYAIQAEHGLLPPEPEDEPDQAEQVVIAKLKAKLAKAEAAASNGAGDTKAAKKAAGKKA